MKKWRIAALCAALVLFCGVITASAGDGTVDYESKKAGKQLQSLGVMQGTGSGDLELERMVTRAEALTLIRRIAEPFFTTKSVGKTPFLDMNGHWAAETAALFYANGFVKGTAKDGFTPNRTVTGSEFITILLRAMGYSDTEPSDVYKNQYAAGLDEIADRIVMSKALTRGQAAQICRQALEGVCADGNSLNAALIKAGAFTEEQLSKAFAEETMAYGDTSAFSDALFCNLYQGKNFMASPLSVKMALAMAANGADGNTLEELKKVTGIDDMDAFNRFSASLISRYGQADFLKLRIANSLWMNQDRTPQRFSDSYEALVREYFDGTSAVVDQNSAVKKVNGWVNEKTNGKIPTIIDSSEFTGILINAIYFKGAWEKEFEEEATREGTFHNLDGTTAKTAFMSQTDHFYYCKDGTVQIVKMPYRNCETVLDEKGEYLYTDDYRDLDVSMYLLMGKKAVSSPAEILDRCEEKNQYQYSYLHLSMPKFKMEYSVELNDALKAMGLQTAFSAEHADFRNMVDRGNMYIDKVLHKTYIDVDEQGTEAAAVTAIMMEATGMMTAKPLDVKFDKPFTFVIRDNTTGEILFEGAYCFVE